MGKKGEQNTIKWNKKGGKKWGWKIKGEERKGKEEQQNIEEWGRKDGEWVGNGD